MHTPGTQLYTLWRKQRRLRVQLVLVGIVIVGLVLWLKPHFVPVSHSSSQTPSSSGAPTLTKGTPTFKTFLPEGKTADAFGGWTRVSPASSAAVYAYSDTLFGSSIIVSQQQLPDAFKDNQAAKIKQLQSDQGYVTQHSIDVDGTAVYIGTSSKSYQSTIFIKNDILLLITSYRTLSDTTVSDYIRSLR